MAPTVTVLVIFIIIIVLGTCSWAVVSILIPVSTLHAVAHSSSWGCCGDSCWCCCCYGGGHCGCGCGHHHCHCCLVLLPLTVSRCRCPLPRCWSSSPGPVVVVIYPLVVGVGVSLSHPMVLSSWLHFLFVAAACSDGVLVAIVVGASPSIPDPAPLSLSSAVIHCPDPLSTPRTGARSGGVWVGVLSRGK
jgi:hypothetical protein